MSCFKTQLCASFTQLLVQPHHAPSSPDAMDIDSSFTEGLVFPPKGDLLPTVPFSAAPGIPSFNSIFFDPSSPGANVDDLPVYQTKKCRSASPQPTPDPVQSRRRAGTISVFNSSSPIADSSPSVLKLERITNDAKKPMLGGLGVPSDNSSKRLRKPNLSAMVLPSDAAQFTQPPGSTQDEASISAIQVQCIELPPPRRAFSAMLPQPGLCTHPSGGSSFEGGEESSPAQAYAKRQQVRTIRRRDGTDDFRSLKGATAMVARDKESPHARKIPDRGTGLGGFGDNEAHGKVLPCRRVREDGLMRINSKTVRGLFCVKEVALNGAAYLQLNDVLDGVFKSRIASYQIIDCRFDYEFSGGHVPGAININTTPQLEEYFLGTTANKPLPSVSGDGELKHVLIFHCEFSAKRAPTLYAYIQTPPLPFAHFIYSFQRKTPAFQGPCD